MEVTIEGLSPKFQKRRTDEEISSKNKMLLRRIESLDQKNKTETDKTKLKEILKSKNQASMELYFLGMTRDQIEKEEFDYLIDNLKWVDKRLTELREKKVEDHAEVLEETLALKKDMENKISAGKKILKAMDNSPENVYEGEK